MILRQFLHTDPSRSPTCSAAAGTPPAPSSTRSATSHHTCAPPTTPACASASSSTPMFMPTIARPAERSPSAAGAEYVLHASADVAFPFVGARWRRAAARQCRGRCAAHARPHARTFCLLVTDRTRADEPWFVLTGHTLMVGDVGRTELADDAASGARTLFASLQTLKALPDHIEVLPGAYAGSVCGRRPERQAVFDHRLRAASQRGVQDRRDEAEFIDFMLADIPPAPQEAAECAPGIPGRGRCGGIISRDRRDAPRAARARRAHRPRAGQNWRQFSLLVLINAFVGGMVGLERTVVPLIGSEDFHLASDAAVALVHRQLRRRQGADQPRLRASWPTHGVASVCWSWAG